MKYFFYILILFLLSCSNKNPEVIVHNRIPLTITYEPIVDEFNAGDTIQLVFTKSGDGSPSLLISGSYGNSVLTPISRNNKLVFIIPPEFSKTVGICRWCLINDNSILKNGQIKIKPKYTKKPNLETYLGPRSIIAGGEDYSMLVVSATDTFDNPILDGRDIEVNQQFKSVRSSYIIKNKNFVAYKNLYSTNETGSLFFGVKVNKAVSKEMSSAVYPALPINFTISTQQNHPYADGNQILMISTNKIRDKYGNLMSDGTLVNFTIKTNKQEIMSCIGLTQNGIASAKILHPSTPSSWFITAHINGAAMSNKLTLKFKQSTYDFSVYYDPKYKILEVKDIRSYMNQLVPDGIIINCIISDMNGEIVYMTDLSSRSGKGMLDLNPIFLEDDSYNITTKLMGIEKSIKIKMYD